MRSSSASKSNVDIPISTITGTYPFGVLPSQLWYNIGICPDATSFLFPSLFLFDPKGPVQPSLYGVHGAMSADWVRNKAADAGSISNAGGGVCTRVKGCSYEFFEACKSSIYLSAQLSRPHFVDVISDNAACYLC
jgi:hypothetical protein